MRNDTLFLILTLLLLFDPLLHVTTCVLVWTPWYLLVVFPGSLKDRTTNIHVKITTKTQVRSQLTLTPHGNNWSEGTKCFKNSSLPRP